LRKRIQRIIELLKSKYGIPFRGKKLPNPVDLLIATILSQNTNDRNSYKAYQNLKSKIESWEEAASLKPSQIESLIKVAGLGKQKSRAIKKLLSSLLKERGVVSLSNLKKMGNEEVLDELTKYPGIGIKTASCVLLFALDRNVCPVDTHVHRTLNRIGLVKTSSPDKTFYLINENLPKGIAHSFHTNLIRLGREYCKPSKPDCAECPVEKICKFEFKMFNSTNKNRQNSFMLLDNV
jgi:endonuclease III